MPLTSPQLTIFGPHNNDTVTLNQPFPVTGNVKNPFVAGEPVLITSVTVQVDQGPVIDADLNPLQDKTQTNVNFAASAQVTGGEDPHTVTVTATNDQNNSKAQKISILTAPAVVPALYSIEHFYVDRTENVTVIGTDETKRVKYSRSFDVLIRHPGAIQIFLYAEYFIHMFTDQPGRRERLQPTTPPQKKILPLSYKIHSPDGVEFAGRTVTLDDLNRFRNLRGVSQGAWRFDVFGESDPIFISDKDGKVAPGKAIVRISLEEPIPSQSPGPLVEGPITAVGAQVFSFDLFRVGQFTVNVQSRSAITPWEGTLRLKAPDGTVVASSHTNRLQCPVTLRTINQSRDAAGQVRQWSLEVDTTTPSGIGSAVRATVIATTRIPVHVLQDRINDLIGFNGSKILVYGENKGGSALGRFKITNVFTAETMNIDHLLDDVIKKVVQDPGIDTKNVDIEPNIAYNFANKSEDFLADGTSLDVSSLKADAIKIRVGASQHILPPVPAVTVELDVEGEADIYLLDGFHVWTGSVNNNRMTLEMGAKLDSSGKVVTVSWMNDDPISLDLDEEAWLAAVALQNPLLKALVELGAEGATEYIEHTLNDAVTSKFRSIVEAAVFQAPRIMWDLLGANFTLISIRMDDDAIAIDYVAGLEPDPKPNPFYTGVIGRLVTKVGPGPWQISPPGLGDTWAADNLMSKIDHIFVVTMENRAFDHVLGYRAATRPEDGLTPELLDFLHGFNVRPLSESAIPQNRAHLKTRFPEDPGHALANVARQLSDKLQTPSNESINSPEGFVDDFASRVGSSGLVAEDVLGFYTSDDLAMYGFLAENYAYCQRYFSAHPGPTLPNRMYSLGGDVQYDRTGEPILDNNTADNFALSRALNIFDLLTRKNISWRVYESFPSVTMLRFFARYSADDTNIVGIGLDQPGQLGQLERDIAVGDVKSVTFIDPAMHSAPENDDHPTADMLAGQVFIKRIYDALRKKDMLWLKTLLIITYDEHGGFYDHVIPPVADALSMTPVSPGGHASGPAVSFKQDMTIPYGLRVPAFVVSPWVPAGKGPDVTLDHCSILKTILARFCGTEKPFLSDRVNASCTFEPYLTETKPRLDVPPPPALPSVFTPRRPPGGRDIVTKPVSMKAFAKGDVESRDLTGMLARLLGR